MEGGRRSNPHPPFSIYDLFITKIMKLQKIHVFFLSFFLLLAFSACKSKKEQPQAQQTEFEENMTAKDTVAVKKLVDQFFTFVKEKQYTDAIAMLYRNDQSKSKTPEPLDNDDIADVRKVLESIPMVDYRIEYIKFNEDYDNEVLCKVIIKKAEGDMPEMTTKMFFKPVNYVGNWVLCLTNSDYRDQGVVDPDKRDSVAKSYQKQSAAQTVAK